MLRKPEWHYTNTAKHSMPAIQLINYLESGTNCTTGHSNPCTIYARLGASLVSQLQVNPLNQEKTDEHLMEEYRDGDINAFDQLFVRFKDPLYRYLSRQTGRPEIAEELIQEVWAAIIKNRHSYTARSKFTTYLYHIAHNKLIDHYRSSKAKEAELRSYDIDDEEVLIIDQSKTQLCEQTDTQTQYEYLMSLLDNLPAAQRDVFLMHEETGMTLIEIAQVMGVSRETVKSRLKYALQKLRSGMRRFS